MRRFWFVGLMIVFMLAISAGTVWAGRDSCAPGSTLNPGFCDDRYDADHNGITDAGVVVSGHYTQFAYDCEYVVNYRGDFGNTPYLDSGWITNSISCPDGHYNYLIVHQSDPRYTGDPNLAEWETWEYHVLTESGSGNLAQTFYFHHPYNG